MSRLRIKIAIIAASIVVLLLVFSFSPWTRNRDLTYEGRHLVDWLALMESSPSVQTELEYAQQAVREIGANALPLLEELVESVREDSFALKKERLLHMKTLLQAREDNERKVLYAYEALGEKALPSVPFLMKKLKADEFWVRRTAAGALGMIGSSAQEAIPSLARSLDDEADFVRMLAAHSLGKICARSNDANTVEALETLLGDENSGVRMRAVGAISAICAGSSDANIVEALKKSLDDESAAVRGEVAHAFGMICTDSNDVNTVEALEKLLNDENSEVRGHAERAITSVQQAEEPRL